jgi:photosystem II stability/assembly factor-like uncharacterized protein
MRSVGDGCRFILLRATLILLAFAWPGLAQWDTEDSGTKAGLRAVHSTSPGVVWASGTNGVVIRSEDDGYLWQQCAIPADAGKLDFRGVWAWDANHAIVMSSGPGAASRLYETTDGCAHWRVLFTNPEATGFWDAIAFWDSRRGILLGDPVDGHFTILTTNDSGKHWSRDKSADLKADSRGEGAFAASNSVLALSRDRAGAYFATGGPGGSRVFHLQRDGKREAGRWSAVRLPFVQRSESAGIFSVALRDSSHGVAVGGNFKEPDRREDTAAWTSDGGVTWSQAKTPPSGYRSAVAWEQNIQAWIAVGPNGSDLSYDEGMSWQRFDRAGWNALSLPWVVGPDGRIGKLSGIPRRNSRSVK